MRRRCCHYCGAPATTLDHIVPKSRGGRRGSNLVPACEPCNARKADAMPTCDCGVCLAAIGLWQHRDGPPIAYTTGPIERVCIETVDDWRAHWLHEAKRCPMCEHIPTRDLEKEPVT